MRPNADISHQLNGRVKDWAVKHDLTIQEAYSKVIKCGIESLEAEDCPLSDDGDAPASDAGSEGDDDPTEVDIEAERDRERVGE